jgi:CPA2 family monovalent cation:H+ antiporter-2
LIVYASQNPLLGEFAIIGGIIIVVALILKYFHQPYIIAYILTGVLIGDYGFELLTDKDTINVIGEFGLVLLLFFIGMEISLPDLIKKWRIPTMGTLLQVLLSIVMVSLLGLFYDWSMNRVIILGFIISLSSSAVVIKLLQDNNEIQSKIGQSVLSILIMQDILIVPMLILTNYLGGNSPTASEVSMQLIGGLLIIAGIVWIIKKKHITIPFSAYIRKDHELQIFMAFFICFGFALFTSFFGLSAALGAFVGGMVVHASRSTEWIHHSLHSFRVIFVAIFFISIGLIIDLGFLFEHWKVIFSTLTVVYLTNHFVNSAVIHYFGSTWKDSLYGGALLAQIGELSFILASSAYFSNIFSDFEYQLTVIIISLTFLISPFWISATKALIGKIDSARESKIDFTES